MSSNLRIDIDRLQERLAELAEIGGIAGTEGCARLALTDEDRMGRDLVITWMRDLGLEVTIDVLGNAVGIMAGQVDGPPVMCGSHIDTVRTGGRYDGNLGVLAGLEIIETLRAAGVTPKRALAVAFFTNEEGARFSPDMLGSLAYVGGIPVEEALAIVGIACNAVHTVKKLSLFRSAWMVAVNRIVSSLVGSINNDAVMYAVFLTCKFLFPHI